MRYIIIKEVWCPGATPGYVIYVLLFGAAPLLYHCLWGRNSIGYRASDKALTHSMPHDKCGKGCKKWQNKEASHHLQCFSMRKKFRNFIFLLFIILKSAKVVMSSSKAFVWNLTFCARRKLLCAFVNNLGSRFLLLSFLNLERWWWEAVLLFEIELFVRAWNFSCMF